MKNRYGSYSNFQIVNADFETYIFERDQFDLVYAASAFRWIPEKIGYPKAYEILKSGGTFAMFVMHDGYTDEPLYSRIQEVYAEYFHPETEYTYSLDYDAREKYGFVDIECREYLRTSEYSANDYVSLISTISDHLLLQEPYKSKFYESIREVIVNSGNKITLYDKIFMYLARKPRVR
jgi:ubiquinone/menaquinone biosynthesis C-methylase UbiE